MSNHSGSCHCGAVKYSVATDPTELLECNCSHCAKKGFQLFFVPASAVTIESGEADLTEYRFNKKHIAHQFCRHCGVQCFGQAPNEAGEMTFAINARTLTDFDQTGIPAKTFDGKSL